MIPFLRTIALSLSLAAAAHPAMAADTAPDKGLQLRLDAVKADPNEPRNYFNLGLEYYNREMLDQAGSAFEQALKVGKKNKEAHDAVDLDCCQILGNIALTKKSFSDAVDWFEKGLKISPVDPACSFGRGQAYYFNKKYGPAKEAFVKYLGDTAGNPKAREQAPQALTYLGAMGLDQKKYDEAAGYFRQVIKEFPKGSKEASYNLSLVLLSQGDIENKAKHLDLAVAKYDEAVAVDDTNVQALKSSAQTHLNIGQAGKDSKDPAVKAAATEHFKIAERNFLRAGSKDQADYLSWYQAGLTEYFLEKFEDMITSYKKSVELNPNQADARYNLSLALLRKNLFEEASAQGEEAKKLKPEDREVNALINQIHDKWLEDLMAKAQEAFTADRVSEAIGYWKQALVLDPHHPDAGKLIEQGNVKLAELKSEHALRGDAAYKEGDLLTASTEWNAALQLDPSDESLTAKLKKVSGAKRIEAIRKQAEAAYKAKDNALALAKIDEALKLNPKDRPTLALQAKIRSAQTSGNKAVVTQIQKLFAQNKLLQAKRAIVTARESDAANKQLGDLLIKVNKRIDDAIAQKKGEASAAQKAGNKDAARKAYEEILVFNPDDREAAASIKALTGKESKSIVSAQQVNMLNKKGIFAYMQNNLTEAEKSWSEALKLDPENNEIKRSLERVRTKLHKGATAAT